VEAALAWAADFGVWKNSPAFAEVDVAVKGLFDALWITAEEETGTTGLEVEVAD